MTVPLRVIEGERLEILHPQLILDPRDPIQIARTLRSARYTEAGQPSLYRHRGAFWSFADCHYHQAEDETVRAEIWRFLADALRQTERGGTAPFKPTRARVSDVLDALSAECELGPRTEPPAWLGDQAGTRPPASEFMAVANGLLHLPTGDLYPATPAYFGLSATEVTFDPDAPEPQRWLAFLADLFGSDQQAIDALQDWFGYALSQDTSQHKVLLVVGPTRSGKGTIARVLTGVIGRASVAAPTLASLSSNFGLEPLIGKPLAIISDARLGGRSDYAVIAERLLSVSGEDTLTIDRKFKPAWHGRLPTRFMLMTNELPHFADSSGALAKRFVVLSLERSFYGREDPGLTSRLLTELPGILNWALVGYERLRQRDYFVQPESAREAIDELETLASPVIAFVQEACHVAAGLEISAEALYAAWRAWCEANGRREPGTIQTFGRNLHAAFPALHIRRPRHGEVRQRTYEGITLS